MRPFNLMDMCVDKILLVVYVKLTLLEETQIVWLENLYVRSAYVLSENELGL